MNLYFLCWSNQKLISLNVQLAYFFYLTCSSVNARDIRILADRVNCHMDSQIDKVQVYHARGLGSIPSQTKSKALKIIEKVLPFLSWLQIVRLLHFLV